MKIPGLMISKDHEDVVDMSATNPDGATFVGADETGLVQHNWLLAEFLPYDPAEYADCECPRCVERRA